MPETLWLLLSYGWQRVEAQHRAQLDLYERVTHILNETKPPDFAWLPKIELGATRSGSKTLMGQRRRSRPRATAPFSPS